MCAHLLSVFAEVSGKGSPRKVYTADILFHALHRGSHGRRHLGHGTVELHPGLYGSDAHGPHGCGGGTKGHPRSLEASRCD